jgi:hypothetical protein
MVDTLTHGDTLLRKQLENAASEPGACKHRGHAGGVVEGLVGAGLSVVFGGGGIYAYRVMTSSRPIP